jgi:hypothetical protein
MKQVCNLNQNTYSNKAKNFNGQILYTDWFGNPVVYTKYENGLRTHKYLFSNSSRVINRE